MGARRKARELQGVVRDAVAPQAVQGTADQLGGHHLVETGRDQRHPQAGPVQRPLVRPHPAPSSVSGPSSWFILSRLVSR